MLLSRFVYHCAYSVNYVGSSGSEIAWSISSLSMPVSLSCGKVTGLPVVAQGDFSRVSCKKYFHSSILPFIISLPSVLFTELFCWTLESYSRLFDSLVSMKFTHVLLFQVVEMKYERSSDPNRPYLCRWEGCQVACVDRFGLREHYRTHTGEKPFCCPLCPYRAAKKCNLKSHVLNRHSSDPWVCWTQLPSQWAFELNWCFMATTSWLFWKKSYAWISWENLVLLNWKLFAWYKIEIDLCFFFFCLIHAQGVSLIILRSSGCHCLLNKSEFRCTLVLEMMGRCSID